MVDETLSVDASDAGVERSAASALSSGDRVGRYHIRRLLGKGGAGQVYLARDMSLGRSVALKLVRRRTGLGPDVLNEAQTTARFNHPHIVQLYDVGRYGDYGYLALEYLEGETLRERMKRERLSLDEVLRLARAIADALVHAHAAGVRHCDLKPSNVMLPRDGRIRVVDFGLASTTLSSANGVAGTPDWMSPEQWRGDPPSDGVDVWALGVMVFELLTGVHPFGVASDAQARRESLLSRQPLPLSPDTPASIADLIRRSITRSLIHRPTASDWLNVVERELAGRTHIRSADAPYRGLAAFNAEDADLFYGRDADIDEMLEILRDTTLVTIVGPSGAGKSSFLHAGVIPRLLARDRWKLIGLRPGHDPFHALANRLLDGASGAQVSDLSAELRATPTLLALRLATLAAAERTKIILAIDQFEELFTQGAPHADVTRFITMLAMTSDDGQDPVRVVVTIRDDFSGRIPGLRDVFVLRPLAADDLRRTITAPLASTGYHFEEPSIVDEMLEELGSDPNLPLLQFACRALWDARDVERRILSRTAYRDLGGIAGALARHADRFVAGLSIEEQALTRLLLLRLVAETSTRRIVERSALLASLPLGAEDVLNRLLAARLVVQRRVEGEASTLVELAHESLLGAWRQLQHWIERTQDQRQLLDDLQKATQVWTRRTVRPEDATWTYDEIADVRRRVVQLRMLLPAEVERFLAAGEARHARQRRRVRRRRVLVLATCAVITVGALVLAQVFRRQRIAAELAGGNLGRSVLVLQPFEWDQDEKRGVRPVPATALPDLTWTLYAPDRDDIYHPGAPFPGELIRVSDRRVRTELETSLEAPGGLAFLRIDGRGQNGARCAPAWVRLQSLPGYALRDQPPRRFEIPVPTCAASAAEMISIPAGKVIYGGPGEPATRFNDYVDPERVVHVASFAIDKTEVSNATFAPFGRLSAIDGYPVPQYPSASEPHKHDGDPDMPVTSIDAFEAEALCAYFGKRLPSDVEWEKAARGGVELDGHPNPFPRRLFPWGSTPDRDCVNGEWMNRGRAWVVPVHALACGASPYGVLNLVGNVSEWISQEGQELPDAPMRVVRGGAVESPWELEQTTTVFRNARDPRHFDFATGVRCVAGPRLPSP